MPYGRTIKLIIKACKKPVDLKIDDIMNGMQMCSFWFVYFDEDTDYMCVFEDIAKTFVKIYDDDAVLQNILSNMNRDIASKASLLLNTFVYEYMRVYYPYLYNGMKIINLRDTGFDVELEVAV